ncbi:MAG: hypothetical protein ACFFAJ_05505 [Candidatus Hodarchaeota archaeon]
MDSRQWFEIIKKALDQIKIELETPQIEHILLIKFEDKTQVYPLLDQNINEQASALLAQAWKILVQILKNELMLLEWNSLSVVGRKKTLTIYSLGIDYFNPIFLLIFHDTNFNPMDVLKLILKSVFQIGYKSKYETVGLIASEGYPVWVSFPEGKEMDDFLFAISVTSLLTLVERIDMEVSAGGIFSCIIQGNENLLLNVFFNPSQDLALAITQKGKDIYEAILDPELSDMYQKIVDPVVFSAIVPEIKDEDRERILDEIRQEFEGEITEEEIQTLNVFDSDTLKSLEDEIKNIAKKYGANEISIGYLRKRMKLPPEVLSMALEYLISTNSIIGRIGKDRSSGREILVMELLTERSREEQEQIEYVQNQIQDLFLPLNPFLSQYPIKKWEVKPAITDEITEALSEFQVMISLSDMEPLFMLTNDFRFLGSQLESSIKTLLMLKSQLTETQEDDILQSELNLRYLNLENKIIDQRRTIIGKVKKFREDILNSYRLLLRLIPPPSEFFLSKDDNEALVVFKCPAYNCYKTVKIKDDPFIWGKLGFFSKILGIYEELPEATPQINDYIDNMEKIYQNLINLAEETTIDAKLEFLPILRHLEELLITNHQRDEAINKLHYSIREETGNKGDFYSLYSQCNTCQRWYCEKHKQTGSKCIYC